MSAIKQAGIVIIATIAIIAAMVFGCSALFGFPFSQESLSATSLLCECPDCHQVHEVQSAVIQELDSTGDDERDAISPIPVTETKQERLGRLQDRVAYAEAEMARIAQEKAEAERAAAEEAARIEAERQAAEAAERAASESKKAPVPSASMSAMSISFLGTTNSYIDTPFWATAPKSGAGLWAGSDSTTDGSWGYFIGHHPGDFYAVMNLGVGDQVKVCDRNGNTKTYSVIDAFTIPDTTWWEELQARVCGYGESVILQTCVGNGWQYRVVVAQG